MSGGGQWGLSKYQVSGWSDREESAREVHTKRFLLDDSRVFRRTVNDSRFDEITTTTALPCRDVELAAGHDVPLLSLDVGKEATDTFELHTVLHGAETLTRLEVLLDVADHRVAEGVVDRFVHVDAFDGEADLAGIRKCQSCNLHIQPFVSLSFPSCLLSSSMRRRTLGATSSTSTSSHTIAGSFPPSSRVTRFNVPAALAMTLRPVAEDPVKLILSMPRWEVRRGPRDSSPLSTWTTPGGKNAWASSTSLMLEYGVYGLV